MRRSSCLLFTCAILAAALTAERAAFAAPANACAPSAVLGMSCSNAGPTQTELGVCELTAQSYGPGCNAASDAAAGSDSGGGGGDSCLTCVYSAPKGCGMGGTSELSGAQLSPTVSGCCSVAGTHDLHDGLGLVAGACLVGLVFVQRRARRLR